MASTARAEVRLRAFAVVVGSAFALVAGVVSAADTEPKVVCESDASGRTMNCRDAWHGEDAAPFRRIAPAQSLPTGAAPEPTRPLLAPTPTRETQAASAPDYLRADSATRRVAPAIPATTTRSSPAPAVAKSVPNEPAAKETIAAPPAPASVVEATPLPPPETLAPAQPPQPKAVQPASSPPAMVVQTVTKPTVAPPVAAEPVREPAPAPAPVAQAEPAPTPIIATPAAPEPVAVEPASAPAEVAAPAPAVALLGDSEFRALDGSHYTLELANAPSAQPLRELAARLALDGAVYLVHLRSPESDRWLLTWGDHAGQSEARSSRQRVPADAAINSGWPRRIAPLQNELVSP